MERISNLLLVIGCQRSGTSILSAMLGRHSEINMLYESTSGDIDKLIGKKYCGNKLLAWRQIRYRQRASIFGHLINRLMNFHFWTKKKVHKVRFYPISKMSIRGYVDRNAKIIAIYRDENEVIQSMKSRFNLKTKQANNEYNLAINELDAVKDFAFRVDFKDLVGNTTAILQKNCNYLNLEFEEKMLQGPAYNYIYPHPSILKEKSQYNL